MSEEKVTPVKAPVQGSTGTSPNQKSRGWIKVPPKSAMKSKDTGLSGGVEELGDVIFDCEDGKQLASFELMLDKLARYIGSKFEHGGELLMAIKNLEPVVLKKPGKLDPKADETDKEIWKLDLAAYVK